MSRNDWNGVVIGYDNGKTAKGVMRFDREDGVFDVWVRTDGREYWVNPDKIAAYMLDPLNAPAHLTGDEVLATAAARKWYSDNTYQGNKE